MKQDEQQHLPVCSLSTECLRLLDDLDLPGAPGYIPDLFAVTDDERDERLLVQLRGHLPTCPTCTALLAQARRERASQRVLLRSLLAASERVVPSTTQRILAEVRSGQMVGQSARATNNHHHDLLPLPSMREFQQRRQRTGSLPFQSHSRRDVYNIMVLAAVAVLVLASVGILGRLVALRSQISGTIGTSTATPPPQAFSGGWDSIVIALAASGGAGQVASTIYNYAPFEGKRTRLLSDCCDAASAIDSISHSGQNVLYHTNTGGKTRYRLLTGGDLATLDCQCGAGDAIWTTDDRNVLVNKQSGVVQVDIS
ncbi:MAG: hypothetical protein M3Z08_17600, partial [Chloroflexota bacterium]|nr:hypothetical protein [Chloroflexota bacterium]